ncbi:MAG: ABC transporter substrate-binding protein, partial [Hyphomicrobiaceae bacterium]
MKHLSALGTLPVLLAALGASSLVEARTFRWAFQGDVQTMDPHALAETMTLSFQGNIYEGLVRRDAHMKLVGALAERWVHLEPRIWRFYLRRNVRFHDGGAFQADDVKFSVERASAKTSGMRGAASIIGSVKIVDPLTVDIVTPRPNPILPRQIELIYMMDRQWSQRHGASEVASIGREGESSFTHMHANGTGPFKLEDRAPGTKTVLERYRNYWGEIRGNVDKAVFTPISNDATRVAALI